MVSDGYGTRQDTLSAKTARCCQKAPFPPPNPPPRDGCAQFPFVAGGNVFVLGSASRIRAELALACDGTADAFADRAEDITDRRHDVPRGGDDVILDVERLGEERIRIAREPIVLRDIGILIRLHLRDYE